MEQLSSPTASVSSARAREVAPELSRPAEENRGNVVGGKRKYRRHPKVNIYKSTTFRLLLTLFALSTARRKRPRKSTLGLRDILQ